MATPKKSAQMAEKTLKFYSDKVAGHGKDENLETRMVDLVGDLMHLAAEKEVDFNEILDWANQHFQTERAGHF